MINSYGLVTRRFSHLQIKTSTGSINSVLEKVRKGKPRQQKAPKSKKEGEEEAPPTAQEVTPPPTRETEYVTILTQVSFIHLYEKIVFILILVTLLLLTLWIVQRKVRNWNQEWE